MDALPTKPPARRSERLLRMLLATILVSVLGLGQAHLTQTARAFDLDAHEAILRTALMSALSADALDEVTNYGIAVPEAGQKIEITSISLAPGTALHTLAFEQLWDNAATPADLCGRLSFLTAALKFSVDQAAPTGTEYRELTDDKKARRAFGLAAVLLSNFYAHTNWVELAADRGIQPTLAPLNGACLPGTLPADLQSGYYNPASGPDGCPKVGGAAKPPAPFKQCFSELGKDTSDAGHGAQRATKLGGQPTYHELARRLAIEATKQLFTEYHDTVVRTYTPETWNANGQCVFDKLTKSSGDPDNPFGNSNVVFRSDASCLDFSGQWIVSSEIDDSLGLEEDDDLTKAITIKQDRSTVTDRAHVVASFTLPDDGSCPLGGGRSTYVDSTLDGLKLEGSTAQCILSENIASYCQFTGVWQPDLTGVVDGAGRERTLHLQFLNQHWDLLTDDDDNITKCDRAPERDTTFEVLLDRAPAPRPQGG
ncbi:MAG: hypothetical protein NVSMB2_05560 [Chloroflexota bacterium]